MVSGKDIAKVCGVSPTTVSNIINNKPNVSEETRQRVLAAMKELNYTPNYVAKNLKTKSTKTIGIIVEDITVFSIPGIVEGISKHCKEENYQMLFYDLRLLQKYHAAYYHTQEYYEEVHQEIHEFMKRQVEGIIYVAGHERILTCLPESIPIPTVVAYALSNNSSIPSVIMDDEDGAFQMISYLISLGHSKIGVITGFEDSPHTISRFKGYQRALSENQIPYEPKYVIEGDWELEGGHKHVDYLLEQNVTAIFCMNDLMAIGAYKRLYELGLKIGEDISIVGFDHRDIVNYFEPSLTTVKLPLHDIGYRSSVTIQQLLQDNGQLPKESIHTVKCYLIEEESVKKIS
jgi:LacI family transcriptional regulator